MSSSTQLKCSACSRKMDGAYCSHCGQRYTGRRVTQNSIVRDLLNNLYGLDRSILSNIWLALKDPQFLVENFWNGYRNYYFGPGRFFVIAALALVINFLVTGESFLLVKIESHEIGQQFVFLFLFLILYSASSYLVYFWPWRRNIAEHIVLNIYNVSLWTILFIPVSIVGGLLENPETAELVNTPSFLLYNLLVMTWNARAFEMRSWLERVGRIALQAVLFIAIFWGLTFLE